MSANASNNICVSLNYTYFALLEFIDEYEFNDEQNKYINNIRLNLEVALPYGKYTTSKLEDFKRREDPTYENQKQFFENDRNYIKEMYEEIEKMKKEYKSYEIKKIVENKLFKEPDNSYIKYEIVKNYSESYKMALLLNDTLEENQREKFKPFMRHLERSYGMAFRMCRKLEDYKKRYPFEGDVGLWKKDNRMTEIKGKALRFRKLNEEKLNGMVSDKKEKKSSN